MWSTSSRRGQWLMRTNGSEGNRARADVSRVWKLLTSWLLQEALLGWGSECSRASSVAMMSFSAAQASAADVLCRCAGRKV